MAGGIRGRSGADYSSTEYSQPWGGIDVSKPSSQIDPGSCVTLNGTIIRGALTNGASITPLLYGPSQTTVDVSAINTVQSILAVSNLNGQTVIITATGVYYRGPLNNPKTFIAATGPALGYTPNTRVGTLVIGNTLYFSSSFALGVYALIATGGTGLGAQTLAYTEISAQNGSGPFIGGDFLFTISTRLCLAGVIGGDGNQSGSLSSITITNGGTGYPASGNLTITGNGQNATGTFTASGGVVVSTSITNPGSGYTSPPTITINGTAGSGFTATSTITAATTPSTTNCYPDRVAWSFPSAYGNFDPHSTLFGGGFQTIADARGLITGVAVFETVAMIAHNGGFTEMVPNLSSSVGANIAPFTFAPLWSADQGVVCRYNSMAQYGSMCCFLGLDQPYMLSPAGLQPFGSKVASLLQDYLIWDESDASARFFLGFPDGLFSSIVEIEGEKHYLLAFTQSGNSTTGNAQTIIYDCTLTTDAWTNWIFPNVQLSAPIYQSFDNNRGSQPPLRDNWLVIAYRAGAKDPGTTAVLQMIAVGKTLFNLPPNAILQPSGFAALMRTEAPVINIPSTRRRLLIEYENLPSQLALATITATLWGQPTLGGYPNTSQAPIFQTFTINLASYVSAPTNAVLTTFSDPTGTAFTALATTIALSTTSYVRIIRVALVDEITQTDQK